MGASSSLRPPCPTRWTCSEGALESILTNYRALQDSLLQLASDGTTRSDVRSKANGFANLMSEFSFFHGICLCLHLL